MKLLCTLLCLLCILLAAAALIPCRPAKFGYGYKSFQRRVFSPDASRSMDHQTWTNFLKETTDCDRSVTSFIPFVDRYRVDGICTAFGGKHVSDNYCISDQQFKLYVVTSELGTCAVRNVSMVTQHIIVACDLEYGDVCLPTHLKENSDNLVPSDFARDCNFHYDVVTMDHSSELRAKTMLSVLLVLLPLALHCILG